MQLKYRREDKANGVRLLLSVGAPIPSLKSKFCSSLCTSEADELKRVPVVFFSYNFWKKLGRAFDRSKSKLQRELFERKNKQTNETGFIAFTWSSSIRKDKLSDKKESAGFCCDVPPPDELVLACDRRGVILENVCYVTRFEVKETVKEKDGEVVYWRENFHVMTARQKWLKEKKKKTFPCCIERDEREINAFILNDVGPNSIDIWFPRLDFELSKRNFQTNGPTSHLKLLMMQQNTPFLNYVSADTSISSIEAIKLSGKRYYVKTRIHDPKPPENGIMKCLISNTIKIFSILILLLFCIAIANFALYWLSLNIAFMVDHFEHQPNYLPSLHPFLPTLTPTITFITLASEALLSVFLVIFVKCLCKYRIKKNIEANRIGNSTIAKIKEKMEVDGRRIYENYFGEIMKADYTTAELDDCEQLSETLNDLACTNMDNRLLLPHMDNRLLLPKN